MNVSKRTQRKPHIAEVLRRNIDTLLEVRRQLAARRSRQDKIADSITRWSGSLPFLYLHVAWFALWLVWNLGFLGLPPFDPYPFGLLTMIVSLEAIFLSAIVLITQNRMAYMSDERADLDLQIDLLAEYEVTKVLQLTDAIADHLDLEVGNDPELPELEEKISPELVLQQMEGRKSELKIDN